MWILKKHDFVNTHGFAAWWFFSSLVNCDSLSFSLCLSNDHRCVTVWWASLDVFVKATALLDFLGVWQRWPMTTERCHPVRMTSSILTTAIGIKNNENNLSFKTSGLQITDFSSNFQKHFTSCIKSPHYGWWDCLHHLCQLNKEIFSSLSTLLTPLWHWRPYFCRLIWSLISARAES